MIRVGCCGWNYFRPKYIIGEYWKEKYASVLQAYASMFSLVEVNSTFYRIPKLHTAKRWMREVAFNKAFEFTVKVNREITHNQPFTKNALSCITDMEHVADSLGAKILLFQTPPGFKPEIGNKRKMTMFFKKARLAESGFTVVWEPRGRWWSQPESIEMICNRFDITCATDPFVHDPVHINNEGICYLRLHGLNPRRSYDYRFTDIDLKRLKSMVNRYISDSSFGCRKVYVLFNNTYMYDDAQRFIRMIK